MRSLLHTKRVFWSAVLVLLTLVSGLSYWSGSRYLDAVRAVEQTTTLQAAIDGALSLLKDAETGERGFILTGDPQFLDPYEAARRGIPQHLAGLRRIVEHDPVQLTRFRTLERLADQKATFIESTIELRRAQDLTGALARVKSGRGKRIMDAIRSTCREMREHEQDALSALQAEAARSKAVATWGIVAGLGLTLVLVVVSLVTTARDERAFRQTAEELAASEEHFRLLAENSNDLVRLLDLEGRTTYVSPSVERLLGFTVAEFLALPPRSLLHPDELGLALSILQSVKDGQQTDGVSTYRLRNKAGEYRSFEVRWGVHQNEAGVPASLHTAGRDVTQRLEAEALLLRQAERLRDLSLRDELTKLYNRRGFVDVAGKAHAISAGEGRTAAMIFVDLNGMKPINDKLGHDAGDAALRDAASVLTSAFRETDVIARLGGDEFAAFVLDFAAADLGPLRQRLRELADQETARHERDFRLSMSLGAAFTDPDHPRSLSDLLKAADAAMYQQKRARQAAGGLSLPPGRA